MARFVFRARRVWDATGAAPGGTRGAGDARVAQVDSLIAMGQFALENLRIASYLDKRAFLYVLGVVIKVKSSTDYKIDWRLEKIQEE